MSVAAAIAALAFAGQVIPPLDPASLPRPAPPAIPPKTVSPLTVVPMGGDPPKLASSFPAQGQTIEAGVLVLKLVFDQKMAPDGFDIAAASGGQAPACVKTPRLLNDEKTFVLLCTTAPNAHYAIALNGASGTLGFANLGDTRAAPATLEFATSKDVGPTDLAAAMKLEKLGELDEPIQQSEFTPPKRPGP
jgi:hypothetical protein